MGGWVNARGRRREGLREPGEAEVTGVGVVGAGGGEGRSHSFTHNFLETEWGCLHKAKNKSKIKRKEK